MRNTLPIHDVLGDIKALLSHHHRLILQAPPGAGKTTAVPLALMDEAWLEGKKIILLSPRRLAARNAASRMAQMLGEPVGERVGYHIRSDKKTGEETRILVITEGILTRYLQRDPALEDTALIIFDEFHERHLHSDLALAFAMQSQECLRDDLKLLVMSATLDTHGLGELLDHPPVISSEGRCFPLTYAYRSPASAAITSKTVVAECFHTLKTALQEEEGDILVFLSGEREIRELTSLIQPYSTAHGLDLTIAPLYGNLTKEEQEKAILPSARRKVVIATNIAETSLTIEGVRIVIDSGMERVMRFDPSSGMERLTTQKISRASADQRSGRAGRTAPGICYRLWSEQGHFSLPPHRDPEIRVCDLTPLALELAAWGADADELRWIDPPASAPLFHGIELLRTLGALDEKGSATPHGRSMLTLGVHPRLSHMMLRAKALGYESEAVVLSTILTEKEILSGRQSSDILERFHIVKEVLEGKNPVKSTPLVPFIQSVRELAGRLRCTMRFSPDCDDKILSLLLSLAYPDRIARARGTGRGKYITSGGKELFLSEHDDALTTEWLVVPRSDGHTTMARIHLCAPISPESLESFAPELFASERSVTFNRDTQRVESREIRRLGAIIIESRPIPHPDTQEVITALIEGIRFNGLEVLPWSPPAKSLLERIRTLAHHLPDGMENDFSDEALLENLDVWLTPHLGTETSIRECEQLDMHTILSSMLSWEQIQTLDRLFPSHFTAPTGSKIVIDYSDPDSPVLSVRIQEMFGLSLHPAVFGGKLPLLIHLLSPAQRPIQMTRDLVGFWTGSYSDVKKELKGRYPKHFWPDDPATAPATSKTKKFM